MYKQNQGNYLTMLPRKLAMARTIRIWLKKNNKDNLSRHNNDQYDWPNSDFCKKKYLHIYIHTFIDIEL